MQTDIENVFRDIYGCSPTVYAKAPGRLEILGNHTDYNEGHVISVAVDRFTEVLLVKSDSRDCFISSLQLEAKVECFNLDNLQPPPKTKDWTCYVKGVVASALEKGHKIEGFKALINTNIPISAGMSSSAALEMALILGLKTLFELELDIREMAEIGQNCENQYIGAQTGLMDQLTSLGGKRDSLFLSEYRNITTRHLPFADDLSFVVINSGVKHDLTAEYNERRQSCYKAANTIASKERRSIKSLRDVNISLLNNHKHFLTEQNKGSDLLYRRALHVVSENDRVKKAEKFAQKNQWKEFGNLLFTSHLSSIENFENSCPELDAFIQLAKHSGLCLGARLSGGGFGGISIHLIRTENIDEYTRIFKQEFSSDIHIPVVCRTSEGAQSYHL